MKDNKSLLIDKSNRKSNFELLRIIAMIMIVMSHFSVHGIGVENQTLMNNILLNCLQLGNLGVIIFCIITGYFMIDTNYDVKRIFKIMVKTSFYSIIFGLFFYISGCYDIHITAKNLIKCFFPTIFGEYWFITYYVLLFILIPFINKFLKRLEKQEFEKLLLIFFLMFYFLPTFTNYSYGISKFIYVMFSYMCGVFIKKHFDNSILIKVNWKIVLFLSCIFLFISTVVLEVAALKFSLFRPFGSYFFGINKIPIFLIAIALFICFKNIKIKNNKFINLISSSTLGVYLISDNNYIRLLLWRHFFVQLKISNWLFFFGYSIVSVFIVYFICSVIDLLYIYILEKKFLNFVDKIYDFLLKKRIDKIGL